MYIDFIAKVEYNATEGRRSKINEELERRKRIGRLIKRLREQAGWTLEQLGQAIGRDKATVWRYEQGEIEIPPKVLRRIARVFNVPERIFEDQQQSNVEKVIYIAKEIPLYSVPASAGNGTFPEAVEIERMIPVTYPNADFAVQVHGDSMEPEVPDKAIAIVQKQSEAQNGDMIVCTYDGWVYVKWYRAMDGRIYLVSENPAYAPILVEPNELFVIHGVVIDVMKGSKPRKKFK